jgi:hypothetical protein
MEEAINAARMLKSNPSLNDDRILAHGPYL